MLCMLYAIQLKHLKKIRGEITHILMLSQMLLKLYPLSLQRQRQGSGYTKKAMFRTSGNVINVPQSSKQIFTFALIAEQRWLNHRKVRSDMTTYEIMAEMNLKKIIAESREVAQALNEFADNLERIEKNMQSHRKVRNK